MSSVTRKSAAAAASMGIPPPGNYVNFKICFPFFNDKQVVNDIFYIVHDEHTTII